ncbi:MAG: inosine/xanthosine triphosphatase [Candidatus Aramenus sp.]|nr:inosine/xanthosine triphosphatase [Candidatus Aramenus sp.]
MLVSVGSTNPAKVEAVRVAIKTVGLKAEVVPVEVEPGVPPQPMCEETYVGARNRAVKSLKKTGADLGIGIEGGVCVDMGFPVAFAVVYVVNNEGKENMSRSASFTLPKSVFEMVLRGMELGEAVDKLFSLTGSKYNVGAIGVLTKYIDRTRLYVDPVIMALYPFYNNVE